MEIREREQLNQFLHQLRQARAGIKDAEADNLIREAVAQQPDANYLLVQRALLLEQALQTSQATIAQLQAEVDQSRNGRGFLADGNTWGQAPGARPAAPATPQSAGAWQAAAPVPAASSWGGGGLLGTVASTAVGVVAGSFLFQGLENIMGHHPAPSWGSAAAPVQPLSDATSVNNFTDTPDGGNDLDSLALDGDSPNDWG